MRSDQDNDAFRAGANVLQQARHIDLLLHEVADHVYEANLDQTDQGHNDLQNSE
jgi:hypothetical protein